MRRLLLAAALLAGCSPEPRRLFVLGVSGPRTARVEKESARLGMSVAPPPETLPSAPAADAGGRLLSAGRLRYLAARAAAEGRNGLCFVLPQTPPGRDLLDYPEEWQALARVAREFESMRPIIESGELRAAPAPAGALSAAWAYQGRVYQLLVNASAAPAVFDPAALSGRRALFSARADAAELLPACDGRPCLPPEGVLWLEGWPRPGATP